MGSGLKQAQLAPAAKGYLTPAPPLGTRNADPACRICTQSPGQCGGPTLLKGGLHDAGGVHLIQPVTGEIHRNAMALLVHLAAEHLFQDGLTCMLEAREEGSASPVCTGTSCCLAYSAGPYRLGTAPSACALSPFVALSSRICRCRRCSWRPGRLLGTLLAEGEG